MCLLCIEFQKQQMTMTLPEARRAFAEMRVSLDAQHVKEVEEMIREAEEKAEEDDDQTATPQP